MIKRLKKELDVKFPIVLFDGDCNFCNSSIAAVVKHEHTSHLRFANLQSEVAHAQLSELFKTSPIPDSLIVIEGNKVYFYADAAFKIAEHLNWYLKYPALLLSIFKGKFADYIYKQIAKRRHFIVRKPYCFVPDPCLRRRFL